MATHTVGFRVFSSVGPLLIAPFAAAVLAATFSRAAEAQIAAPRPLNAQLLPYGEPPLAHTVQQQMRLSFHDPWAKYCSKEQDANAKQVCFTGIDGQDESGQSVVAAVIIALEGEPGILRVILPLGVRLVHGTRVIVDNDRPLQAPYAICFANGCTSDYEAPPELIARVKDGRRLVIQAINADGAALTFSLPLAEFAFAKAYEGPPTDWEEIQENPEKLWRRLWKRYALRPKDDF